MPDSLQPDWRAIIEDHLSGLRVPLGRRDEICRELAAHLEDQFERLSKQLPEKEAMRQSLLLLTESAVLSREIDNAEEEDPMNQRFRTVWLPAFAMLSLYTLLFVVLVRFTDFFKLSPSLTFGIGLAVLVAFGGAGAHWARALGASVEQRIFVSISPVLMGIASLVVALPFHAFKTGQAPLSLLDQNLLVSVLTQAGALLLGALPFLKGSASASSRLDATPQTR